MISIKFLCAFLLIWTVAAVPSAEEDFTLHCYKCKCMWSDGKKRADCTGLYIREIPRNLSSLLRDIDFSNNPIYELRPKEFLNANLHNVHKLKLQNCSIEDVYQSAFDSLALLIELDMSKNNIVKLHKNIFRETAKLRILILSHNKINALPDGLFYNMTHLQRVDLSYNQIKYVSPKVFALLDRIVNINLANNVIEHMNEDFTENLPKLSSLDIEGNPWVCDCHLEPFRQNVLNKALITIPTMCEEPPRLKGKLWKDTTVIFACAPNIVDPLPGSRIDATSTNFTISCKVLGEPQPDVDWVSNGRSIERDPRTISNKYSISRAKKGLFTWNNLTIINVNYRDRGEYKCIAKNPAGVDERNLTVIINSECDDCGLLGPASSASTQIYLILGLSIFAIVLVIIIVLILVYCCRKSSRNYPNKRHDLSQSSEYIGLDGRPEMEKSLITDVNPIVKPPRQCSIPPSVTSGGTEVSEVNKTLLDGDSSYGGGDDESRSYDFEPRFPKSHLDMDFRTEAMYPPDLLPTFPHRGIQVSPAGSSASTVADTSRLAPNHVPHSPLTNTYDPAALYRTLPYSRSQSPFVSPMGFPGVRMPRQGAYVTIPRRPRQSWSSEPPGDIGEPLYDNLGLRTSATGSSEVALNKLGKNSPKVAKFPPPIADEPEPQTASAMTLPRITPAHRTLSPTWARNATLSTEQTNNRRDSVTSLPPPGEKVHKIPPQPPPKPKKRTSTGPLFEDEGEDGTEV